jgi:excisionase family DNA binding protein
MEERRGMSTPTEHDYQAGDAAVALTILLPRDQLETLALRVADLLGDRRDDGFLDVDGAAGFLSTTRKAIYHLVERRRIRSHRLGGRLLFDPAELREDVERCG